MVDNFLVFIGYIPNPGLATVGVAHGVLDDKACPELHM